MAYKLIITEKANELLDNSVNYLLKSLNNKQAAIHLLDDIERVYERLEENPFQFPVCKDPYLASKGYREIVIPGMKYILFFSIDKEKVYVLGIFHQLESYQNKM